MNTGSEPGQLPRPVRQRAESKPGRKIKCATADRPVPAPCIEDDVTVQHARRNAHRLVVEDAGAGRDFCEVGECDGAMASSFASEPCAILLYTELSVSRVVRRYRRYSYEARDRTQVRRVMLVTKPFRFIVASFPVCFGLHVYLQELLEFKPIVAPARTPLWDNRPQWLTSGGISFHEPVICR